MGADRYAFDDGTDNVRVVVRIRPEKIVVLQRGWVVVGLVEEDGDKIIIHDAAVVRRWGTSKGLGELAAKGPLPQTVLDPGGRVEAHKLAVVLTIDCTWS